MDKLSKTKSIFSCSSSINIFKSYTIIHTIRDEASDGYLDFDNMYWDSKKSFSAFYYDSYFK